MRRCLPSLSSPLVLVAASLGVVGGCLGPTNPCDPEADADQQRTSTLSGVVKDQTGAPLSGVTVTIPGHATPAISGDDGGFRFSDLPPNATGQGYEVIALPDEPAVGGRVLAPPLGCKDAVSGVELVVAVPPASPEVEITQATSAERLMVAFAAASGSTRYVVEVRAPFETWQPAVLAKEPSFALEGATAEPDETSAADSSSEEEARGFCEAFRYALPVLDNENARCAEVVGTRSGEDILPLDAHGSYEVRVRAEAVLAGELVTTQRLPDLVRSAAAGVPGELSLVPTALLPIMLDPDEETHAEKLRTMDIDAVVPVADGRFAMLGRGAGSDGMMIVGNAASTAPDVYESSNAAPAEAMAYDADSEVAAAEVSEDSGTGLAILPAGRWVRVWKRFVDPGTFEARSQVEKVFIGETSLLESHTDQPEPEFGFDLEQAGLGGDLRAFSWLVQPEGRLVGEGPYNPPDGYLLLLRSGYVLLEREGFAGFAEPLLQVFAEDLEDGAADGIYGGGGSADSPNAMTTGVCQQLGQGALGVEGALGQRSIRACLDLEGALGQALDLTDVEILRSRPDATLPRETFHVLADAAGDRVLAVKSDALLGREGLPLVDLLSDVPTGVQPGAMTDSRLLSCAHDAETPVVLVGNRGSLDVSVLAVAGSGPSARVEEIAIVAMPGVPMRFLDDPDGAGCVDPYTWVVLDDGRMVALDMREERLGVPTCGDEACAVRSSERSPVGGVSRNAAGKSRVVVGGRGMLGEVGFLRPSSGATR